ncbi:MAG: arsenic efflux protein [Clostridia bacterium]|nr:arsenic efflux protein [Clostridia bacterium]
MLEIIEHTLEDTIKLLPFLFITYLIMEYIEHKMGEKSKNVIKKSGKFGPFFGSILGIFPQCGFSVSATNLYAGRVITLGTLIAVYLSTSDEMLPIFISEAVSPIVILKILGIKLIIGMIAGVIIDLVINLVDKNKINKEEKENNEIGHMCEEEHCHCDEKGILKSAIHHTLSIFVFIILITFIINIVVHFVGEDTIASWILNKPIIGPMISSLIGLIPNCASSVIITNMYLENVISLGSMISGLLTGAGVGLAVLFKTNNKLKENVGIIALLYIIGVISGVLIELIGITL